jgi:hypothetical protein
MGLVEDVLARLFPPRPDPIDALRARGGRRVLVRGHVVPRDLIASPLTGERCVYYRYVVEEIRPTTVALGGGGLWVVVDQDEAIAEFTIDDGTGRALVLPERAEITAAGRGHRVEVPSGQRASEVRIVAGDLVEVGGIAGELEDLLDDTRGYRELAARATVAAPGDDRLRIRLLSHLG